MADDLIAHARHFLARFTVNGVAPSDFEDVLKSLDNWDDWCRAWSERAAVHERMGREALDNKLFVSAADHYAARRPPTISRSICSFKTWGRCALRI